MTNRLSSVILIIILLSCSRNTKFKGDFTDDSIKDIIHLSEGKVYTNDSLFIGSPRRLKFHPDSFLIFEETGMKFHLKIIDLKNNHIQEVIPNGRGPGEMLQAWGIYIIGKELFAFCFYQRKVIRLSPNEKRIFVIKEEFSLDVKDAIEYYPINENLIVCQSAHDDSRLTFVDGKGKTIKKMGDFPPFQSASNLKGDNDIFQSSITGSPEGDKIAVACKRTDVLEIYDLNKNTFKRYQGPLAIKLKVTDMGIAKSLDPHYATYVMLRANEREFWASYNGYKYESREQPPTSAMYPKQIYCFDWDGVPLRKFILEYPFGGFDIDWNKKILYTIEYRDNYPKIIEYQLSNYFR